MNIKKHIPANRLSFIAVLAVIGLRLSLLTAFPGEPASITAGTGSDGKQSSPAVRTAIAGYEPALAVRASACLTCHAKIYSTYITDFGYGSPYFFGNPGGGNKVGPFNGSIYGDFIADPGKTSWLTAEIHKDIIVPKADLAFDLKNAAAPGIKDELSYRDALQAPTLAKYLQALESQKASPARVIEKKRVFIGAPDVATLETRFGIAPGKTDDFKYIKNDPETSPDIEGIQSNENGYFNNNAEIVCDGDLFVRGILFLNRASIVTHTGCRIYAAGPIFLQNAVTFKSGGGAGDRANLQLVSTEAIFLGVGRKKCNTTAESDPLSSRLLLTPSLSSIITRAADGALIPPETFAKNLYNQAALVPLEDSSCHDENLSFSGILLNAPLVHSRYRGNFKGLVIAEFALFWQGKSRFEFDPVFKEVPVLPLLRDEDFLRVE